MELNNQFFSKYGYSTIKLAREMLKFNIGDRIPSVSELAVITKANRGTVFNAYKMLVDSGAIRVESKGRKGSYLINKDMHSLLKYANISNLFGAMPLPYSKRYEGLASGLMVALSNSYGITANLAYMRGALSRIQMLLQGRYDFIILSRYAFDEYQKEHDEIISVMDFGEHSYSEHALFFHDDSISEIKDGMRVGVDNTSIDQHNLTQRVCNGKNVQFVPMEYSKLIARVMAGEIDAAVMNADEAMEKHMKINYHLLGDTGCGDTVAVMAIRKDSPEIAEVLRSSIDPNVVLNIQRLVIEEKITPNY